MIGAPVFRYVLTPGWAGDSLARAAQAVPSLDLNFAATKNLGPLVTFTRASSATYVGSDGLIKTATTNLQRWSEEFTQGQTPINATLTANQGVAPNKTPTADQFLETTANGLHSQEIVDHIFIAGVIYTFSCYAKTIGNRNFGPGFPTLFGSARFGFFDLTGSGSVVSTNAGITASIQAVGDGWYRCSITSTCVTGGGARVGVFIVSGTSISYAGDTTKGLLLWGAQLEQSSTVGEYIPTTSTINSAPRFDHNPKTGESLGLLVEEQRTNLIIQSENFGTTWTTTGLLAFGSGSTLNATAAPDGANTADLVTENTTTSEHRVETATISWAANTTYTFSVFAKASGRTRLGFLGVGGANFTGGREADFNLTTGTVISTDGSTASVQSFPNGWHRLRMTFVTSAAPSASSIFIRLNDAAGNFSYTGDGTSGLFLWGAQLEVGAFPTSYTPTTTAAVTRSADVASITTVGSNIRSLFAQFRSPASGTRPVVSLDDNTANERIEILTSGTDPKLLVTDGGSAVADLNGGTVTANVAAPIAARFNTDDYAISINGGTSQLDASGTLPTVDRVRIGSNQAGGYLNGTIARIAGWDTVLPNLPSITQ